ncbi:hypothetical protein H4S02_010466 [Coemansia sp. RSA 2611]|nr:hypothetical protein IWW54_006703 [Coemansia sp. RSA 2705]KAJ2359557.1 hypothetical protein H4S01_006114 [Coemansia sp. RSA 2610]KAJ2366484.1 hypothetical protein H4S02_010466 [Coemansia sp. RSA 2611]
MDIREITDAALLSDKQRSHHCSWPECHKSFTRKSDLKRHYRIHTNEKPYGCTYAGCGKRFVQKSALTVHLRTHSGEKPHCCKEPGCGKRFSDSSSLARHRHTHSGKRSYACSFRGCNKQFYTKSAYNSHHRGHMESLARASTPPLLPRSPAMSDSDASACSSPATPPTRAALPPGVLPPLHEYLGVLSKAACAQAPLPLPTFPPLLRPLPRQLHDRSTLPCSRPRSPHRFGPY